MEVIVKIIDDTHYVTVNTETGRLSYKTIDEVELYATDIGSDPMDLRMKINLFAWNCGKELRNVTSTSTTGTC